MTASGAPHPLADCDPADCYQTMMGERTALITARREAEDNLVKTVIQLASALLALLAGFVAQAKLHFSLLGVILFAVALAALAVSIVAGLLEQRYASQAYLEQQKLVEEYFQQKIVEFDEPMANQAVRRAQTIAFASFVAALLCLGIFAFLQAWGSYVQVQRVATTKGAATESRFDKTSTGNSTNSGRHSQGRSDKIGGSVNAATASAEGKKMTDGSNKAVTK